MEDCLVRVSGGWECIPCKKVYTTRDEAELHARSHGQGNGQSCPVCLKDFKGIKSNNKTIIVKHINDKHPHFFDDLFSVQTRKGTRISISDYEEFIDDEI